MLQDSMCQFSSFGTETEQENKSLFHESAELQQHI